VNNLVRRIKILTSSVGTLFADLTDENPLTADAFWEKLPIEGKANLWGDEIYFSTSISVETENPRSIVKIGDVAYWPPGKAVCLFFSLTPVSRGNEIQPASPVNVFGRIEDNVKLLKLIPFGEKVRLERG
jgi:hypothetical protein